MRKMSMVLVTLVALVAVTGCGKKPKPSTTPSGDVVTLVGTPAAQPSGAAGAGANTGGFNQGGTASGALGPAGELGSQRVIYFDFDNSDIRPEFVDVVAAHGRFLAANPALRVRLEGHTDERGSREYNIALGERRSQTVRRALALQGVKESQIATVSYGAERPAVAGSDESAYTKNRRVELFYIN